MPQTTTPPVVLGRARRGPGAGAADSDAPYVAGVRMPLLPVIIIAAF